ncbi:MAG: hemolysin family protein [Candidatus Thermoplasmatota archaeon]|nr:hemolysin family protein [Candidatus Thermoplasmatota archaeon]
MILDFWIVIAIIFLIILLILSALFSAAEMALITVSRVKIRERAKRGEQQALIIENLLKEPHKLVTGILVGNNLVNVCASIVAGAIALKMFGNIGIAVATVIMTFIILLFCEITPKAFAMRNEKLALRIAKPIACFTKLFSPIAAGFTYLVNSIIKAFGRELPSQKITLTERELRTILEIAEEQGSIKRSEREMIHEVFEFDQIPLISIMVPENRVVSIEAGKTVDDFLELAGKEAVTKMPVYAVEKENIIGIVNVKDALKKKGQQIKQIMKPAFKLRFSERADEALRKMRRAREHLAIIVDENDKPIGIITLEDLIEEIVGEIEE